MTEQVMDRARYQGRDFFVIGVEGSGLFTPAAHGIHATMWSTACHRGYHCDYRLEPEALLLTAVHLGLAAPGSEHTRIFGRTPRRFRTGPAGQPLDDESGGELSDELPEGGRGWSSDFRVAGLAEVMPMDGGLVLGAGWLDDSPYFPGFRAATAFETVLEVRFEHRRVRSLDDRSARLAALRAELRAAADGAGVDRIGANARVKAIFRGEYQPCK